MFKEIAAALVVSSMVIGIFAGVIAYLDVGVTAATITGLVGGFVATLAAIYAAIIVDETF